MPALLVPHGTREQSSAAAATFPRDLSPRCGVRPASVVVPHCVRDPIPGSVASLPRDLSPPCGVRPSSLVMPICPFESLPGATSAIPREMSPPGGVRPSSLAIPICSAAIGTAVSPRVWQTPHAVSSSALARATSPLPHARSSPQAVAPVAKATSPRPPGPVPVQVSTSPPLLGKSALTTANVAATTPRTASSTQIAVTPTVPAGEARVAAAPASSSTTPRAAPTEQNDCEKEELRRIVSALQQQVVDLQAMYSKLSDQPATSSTVGRSSSKAASVQGEVGVTSQVALVLTKPECQETREADDDSQVPEQSARRMARSTSEEVLLNLYRQRRAELARSATGAEHSAEERAADCCTSDMEGRCSSDVASLCATSSSHPSTCSGGSASCSSNGSGYPSVEFADLGASWCSIQSRSMSEPMPSVAEEEAASTVMDEEHPPTSTAAAGSSGTDTGEHGHGNSGQEAAAAPNVPARPESCASKADDVGGGQPHSVSLSHSSGSQRQVRICVPEDCESSASSPRSRADGNGATSDTSATSSRQRLASPKRRSESPKKPAWSPSAARAGTQRIVSPQRQSPGGPPKLMSPRGAQVVPTAASKPKQAVGCARQRPGSPVRGAVSPVPRGTIDRQAEQPAARTYAAVRPSSSPSYGVKKRVSAQGQDVRSSDHLTRPTSQVEYCAEGSPACAQPPSSLIISSAELKDTTQGEYASTAPSTDSEAPKEPMTAMMSTHLTPSTPPVAHEAVTRHQHTERVASSAAPAPHSLQRSMATTKTPPPPSVATTSVRAMVERACLVAAGMQGKPAAMRPARKSAPAPSAHLASRLRHQSPAPLRVRHADDVPRTPPKSDGSPLTEEPPQIPFGRHRSLIPLPSTWNDSEVGRHIARLAGESGMMDQSAMVEARVSQNDVCSPMWSPEAAVGLTLPAPETPSSEREPSSFSAMDGVFKESQASPSGHMLSSSAVCHQGRCSQAHDHVLKSARAMAERITSLRPLRGKQPDAHRQTARCVNSPRAGAEGPHSGRR